VDKLILWFSWPNDASHGDGAMGGVGVQGG
jgi:hypothetical protein